MKRFYCYIISIAIITATSIIVCACNSNTTNEQAEDMLQQAKALYEKEKYDEALVTIDSLRKAFPKAIDTRKEALRLYQDIELTRAQKELEAVDEVLITAKKEYETQKSIVDKLKAEGSATAEQLTKLTRMQMRKDSLQVKFDVLCAKIRYIRKKQAE